MKKKNKRKIDFISVFSKIFLFPLYIFGVIMKFYDKFLMAIGSSPTKKDS